MSALVEGLSYVLNLSHFPFLLIGVAGGIVVGALPGLTGSVGIILLLPFLYYLEPATVLDGYPLAEKGEAGKAIGVATIASTMGGIISTLCMIFISPQLAQFLILGLGLASVKVFPRILKVPISILFPVIFALCFLGSFSLNNSIYDMFVALLFGVIGYFMRKHGFAAAPMILGVILGPLAERELGKALIMSHGNWATLVQSPIALAGCPPG